MMMMIMIMIMIIIEIVIMIVPRWRNGRCSLGIPLLGTTSWWELPNHCTDGHLTSRVFAEDQQIP